MLKYLSFFACLFLFSCTNQQASTDTTDKSALTDVATPADPLELEKAAFAKFQKNPVSALPEYIQAGKAYHAQKNHEKAGMCYLNIANIYDEHVGKLDSALYFAEESLERWQIADKGLQIANLQKYVGLLQGKTGDFSKGKYNCEKAIQAYQLLNFPEGEAVAEFDLAQVLFHEKNYKESAAILKRVNAFWKKKEENDRIFSNNLLGIELYNAMDDKKQVQATIAENEALIDKIRQNDYVLNRFKELKEMVQNN